MAKNGPTDIPEIQPLNVSDLDVEELERRLELATLSSDSCDDCYSFTCTSFDDSHCYLPE